MGILDARSNEEFITLSPSGLNHWIFVHWCTYTFAESRMSLSAECKQQLFRSSIYVRWLELRDRQSWTRLTTICNLLWEVWGNFLSVLWLQCARKTLVNHLSSFSYVRERICNSASFLTEEDKDRHTLIVRCYCNPFLPHFVIRSKRVHRSEALTAVQN